MDRRQVIVVTLGALVSGCNRTEPVSIASAVPEKIHLIPDIWNIRNVGRLQDGKLFWVDSQLDPANGVTTDFVCTFVFDSDGHLAEHSIDRIGARGTYPDGSVAAAVRKHLAALGDHTIADIRVRLFRVEDDGIVFGLIPRQTQNGEWRVEFMPGNTLSFYPPWEAGAYDT